VSDFDPYFALMKYSKHRIMGRLEIGDTFDGKDEAMSAAKRYLKAHPDLVGYWLEQVDSGWRPIFIVDEPKSNFFVVPARKS
jgi:hypothetical protein